MNKGQIISGDFVISIVIFLFILVIILPLFAKLSDNRQEKQFLDDAQTKLLFVTDSITKTGGMPDNWDETNVKSIGLSDKDGRINKTKIKSFIRLKNNTVKALLSLGGYEFNISFFTGLYPMTTGVTVSPAAYFYFSNNSLFPKINNSGLVWDLYYGLNFSPPQVGDARNVYWGPKVDVFNNMTANSTQYKTIIIGDPVLVQSQVNITALKDFVNKGGILIFRGRANLIFTGFSMHGNTAVIGNRSVVKDDVFVDLPYNSSIDYASNSQWYFYESAGDSKLHISIENNNTPGIAYAGWWNHGIGIIYYINDVDSNFNRTAIINDLTAIGTKAQYSTGTMQNAFATNRPFLINTDLNSIGRLTMVVGK